MLRRSFIASVAGIVSMAMCHAAGAQEYPTKPIQFIAPIPAGGSTDILARDIGRRLTERWGQPVVVINRPGVSGSIGTAAGAVSPPDGYTILLVNSSHSINPHIVPKLNYDALKDFAPVVLLASLPMLILTHPSMPVHSLADLIALAKAKPGSITYGTSGVGGASHLTGELFQAATKIKMVHVPYKGSAIAVTDAIGGHINTLVADAPLAQAHVKSGALRPLAITSKSRIALMPDVPTFTELGVSGMEISIWVGILAPARTPPEIVRKLNREIVAILHEPAMAERVKSNNFELVASTPEEFAATIRSDYERFGAVIRSAQIKPE